MPLAPPTPEMERVVPDRSGRFLRWSLGCVVMLIVGIIAVSILSILAAITLPAIARSREAARRSECQDHLKQIGMAIKRFEEEQPSAIPRKMTDLYPKYVSDVRVFACPSSSNSNREPSELDEWSAYEFVVSSNGNDEPIVRDKNAFHLPAGRNELYKDGHVNFVRYTDGKPAAAVISHASGDPISVARVFLTALAAKDVDAALQHVAVSQRTDFMNLFGEGLPPIPANFELKLESVVENKKAQVQVANSEIGLDLVHEGGRWWIGR